MRFLHFVVVAALLVAAVDVYRIKFESIVQAQRAAKLRTEIERERDAIAALRAQWAQLDNPTRIQALAQRHLALKPIDPTQFDSLDRLPVRPPSAAASAPAQGLGRDPIAIILDGGDGDMPTGSIGTVEIVSPATSPGEAR